MTAKDPYPLALAIVNYVADQRCGVTIPQDAREWMAREIAVRVRAEQLVELLGVMKGRAAD